MPYSQQGVRVSIPLEYGAYPLSIAMVFGCATLDLAMLRWIVYIKSLNPDIRHISGKDNAMADRLSRARYEDEHGMVSENEEVGADFFTSARLRT